MTMTESPISDEELSAMALAADPEVEIASEAVPWTGAGAEGDGLLPGWYMPVPVAGRRGWVPRVAAALVIVSFLVINALGFCITYGHLEAV
jgi:hypothetical protein